LLEEGRCSAQQKQVLGNIYIFNDLKIKIKILNFLALCTYWLGARGGAINKYLYFGFAMQPLQCM
jgi:hypothetical protein